MQLRAELCPPSPRWLWRGYHCPLDKELHRAYGFGCDFYWTVFVTQGEVCGICLRPPTTQRLVVDEDEDTHEFRGLLHRGCNGKVTPGIVRYILDPPARRVGRHLVSEDRFARRQRRLDARRRARARRREQEAAPAAEPQELGYADRLAAARQAARR